MTSKRGGPRIAGPGKRNGRPRKTLAEKRPDARGLVTVRIDPAREMVIRASVEDRLLAQRLMLYDWPGVATIDELFAYALHRLAQTTDD